jgi:hypothetical protein
VATTLHLQEPGLGPESLLTQLIGLVERATGGGGIFAWASAGGVRALLEHQSFGEMLERGPFKLVVGTDTITSQAALDALQALTERHANLTVRAFLHASAALFHPKFAWFRLPEGLALVVGSGNLTPSGMQGNWEIYTVNVLGADEQAAVEHQLSAWFGEHESELLDLTDLQVVARVAVNRADERTLLRGRVLGSRAPEAHEVVVEEPVAALVAEPVFAAGRAGQANFQRPVFTGFFGARPDEDSYHVFHRVLQDGSISETRTVKAVTSSRSRNFRFELATPTDIGRAETGYPITVFLRLPSGEFLYQLVEPGEAGFDELDQLLETEVGPQGSVIANVCPGFAPG